MIKKLATQIELKLNNKQVGDIVLILMIISIIISLLRLIQACKANNSVLNLQKQTVLNRLLVRRAIREHMKQEYKILSKFLEKEIFSIAQVLTLSELNVCCQECPITGFILNEENNSITSI